MEPADAGVAVLPVQVTRAAPEPSLEQSAGSCTYKHITLGCCIAIGNRRHSWCFSQRGGDEEEEEDSAPQQQQTSCDWQKNL
ncbi:hypothetical protein INR49_011003 [Caranx melampygus]|nr:hypothetical protein INR49_011003 [Caranx melampygus]